MYVQKGILSSCNEMKKRIIIEKESEPTNEGKLVSDRFSLPLFQLLAMCNRNRASLQTVRFIF